MASLASQSKILFSNPIPKPNLRTNFVPTYWVTSSVKVIRTPIRALVVPAATAEKSHYKYPGEAKEFVDELRFAATKWHTTHLTKEGEKKVKKPEEMDVTKWTPSIEGYLRFLVDSKLVYDTHEKIVEKPFYAEFRNTGLERSKKLATDLEWFRNGYTFPESSKPGVTYALYLEELSENNPPAFFCHFYNIYIYLAHSHSEQMFGRKLAEQLHHKKELEFYKCDGDHPQLVHNVKEKLNKVAKGWTRKQKDLCVYETDETFEHLEKILPWIRKDNHSC